MKKTLILSTLALFLVACNLKPVEETKSQKFEKEIIQLFNQEKENECNANFEKIFEKFYQFISENPDTFGNPFPLLRDSTNITITISENVNLQIYNIPNDGSKYSGQGFSSIFQFISNYQTHSFEFAKWINDENNYQPKQAELVEDYWEFAKIYTVEIKNKVHYIIEGRYDYLTVYGVLLAFEIENDKLVLSNIFKKGNDLTSSIECQTYGVERDDERLEFSKYDKKTKSLYISNRDDSAMKNMFFEEYKLIGDYFEFVGNPVEVKMGIDSN